MKDSRAEAHAGIIACSIVFYSANHTLADLREIYVFSFHLVDPAQVPRACQRGCYSAGDMMLLTGLTRLFLPLALALEIPFLL